MLKVSCHADVLRLELMISMKTAELVQLFGINLIDVSQLNTIKHFLSLYISPNQGIIRKIQTCLPSASQKVDIQCSVILSINYVHECICGGKIKIISPKFISVRRFDPTWIIIRPKLEKNWNIPQGPCYTNQPRTNHVTRAPTNQKPSSLAPHRPATFPPFSSIFLVTRRDGRTSKEGIWTIIVVVKMHTSSRNCSLFLSLTWARITEWLYNITFHHEYILSIYFFF